MAGEKLISIMQQAALGAVGDSVPAGLVFGAVISTNPLKVKVDNRLELTKDFLVVPEHLTDRKTQLSFDDPGVANDVKISNSLTSGILTTDPDTPTELSKSAKITGEMIGYLSYVTKVRHEVTVYNALKTGDRVALLQAAGGQKYYILDKVVM